MLYAIISDIHANLEALLAVLDDIGKQQIARVICLGDIVGYYPNPNECVEICRNRRFQCIRGNHDDAAVGAIEIVDFNPAAQHALRWTIERLTENNKEWLRKLPEQRLIEERILAVHGSPWHPYDYIFTPGGAARAFAYLSANYPNVEICFFGHTHQRALYSAKKGKIHEVVKNTRFRLEKGGIYLINPGSVGQARDGRPGASYILFDSEQNEVEFRHVDYDIELTQRKVISAGLPLMLAERLVLGL
ncbi:MAG: metallophosphoesterase family protein [Thermacetogeniaceae bacterium]